MTSRVTNAAIAASLSALAEGLATAAISPAALPPSCMPTQRDATLPSARSCHWNGSCRNWRAC